MAKTKISEFDTNPDLNTDINSINIAEGCAPSGINNAIRTLMSDLKEWQSGAQDIYIAPAGTAAAPSWTFNGDLDTGFYRVTANELGVAAGGSGVGRFTSAGFVGNITGNAGTVTNGVYTTGNQTIDGTKTFSTSPVLPTPSTSDNSTSAATTAYVVARVAQDAPTKSGSGATGTWGINISGSAVSATTQAYGTNNTTIATTAFVQAALQALHPVGSIYINATSSTNPATLFGFGTWVAFGAGRVPVGFDSGNALFDSAEETGGSADAIVVSHTHSFSASATTGTESASHTHSGTTDSGGSHSGHSGAVNGGGHAGSGWYQGGTQFGLAESHSGHTHTFTTGGVSANHTHSVSVSGTTGSTGSSGTNANYQPYITVYMWKRTA